MFLLPLVFGLLLLETSGVWASPTTSDTNVKVQVQYTPDYLLSLGQSLNSPLLKLIGQTLCSMKPPCSDWSQWSSCSKGSLGEFGIRNRTRMCGHKDGGCRADSIQTAEEETERSLCEGFFSSDFNLTQHGFCLKYIATGMNLSTTVKHCQEEGAHVVNINSKNKLDDIKSTFKTSSSFWVDGTRSSNTSPWVYTHGESPLSMNWKSGQPNNVATELCMVFSTDFHRYDGTCTSSRHVVCETIDFV